MYTTHTLLIRAMHGIHFGDLNRKTDFLYERWWDRANAQQNLILFLNLNDVECVKYILDHVHLKGWSCNLLCWVCKYSIYRSASSSFTIPKMGPERERVGSANGIKQNRFLVMSFRTFLMLTFTLIISAISSYRFHSACVLFVSGPSPSIWMLPSDHIILPLLLLLLFVSILFSEMLENRGSCVRCIRSFSHWLYRIFNTTFIFGIAFWNEAAA